MVCPGPGLKQSKRRGGCAVTEATAVIWAFPGMLRHLHAVTKHAVKEKAGLKDPLQKPIVRQSGKHSMRGQVSTAQKRV